MKQITLRNVPEVVHKELKVAAVDADVSLQDLVAKILDDIDAREKALQKLKQDQG